MKQKKTVMQASGASTISTSSYVVTQEQDQSSHHKLSFQFEKTQPELGYGHVIIPASIIDVMYHETARTQQRILRAPGFSLGNVPIAYIQKHLQTNLMGHLKEFLFKYNVLNNLFRSIREEKIPVAGAPRLTQIKLNPHEDAYYTFELSLLPAIEINEWKYLPFKAPKRKNYKDLDRQVESFVKQEQDALKECSIDGINVGDWVYFSLAIADPNNKPLINGYAERFWFKVGNEDVDNPLRSMFLDKKIGDTFYSTNIGLQTYFGNQLDTNYNFEVTIIDILHYGYFCFDLFKRHFRAKTNKDMGKKLIEVFSYRNDISQRRSMVDETLKLLINKNRFDIPNHIILREQKNILEMVRENPDYNVYRTQKNFTYRVRQLAEKLAKEQTFIDHLAYTENISIDPQEVKAYLNLTLRPRMREFLYFKFSEPLIEGQEVPIPEEELNRIALREKAINYAIYQLTKK
ncbi:MAG TPA: trigger factor [Candidatus Dependentiae bacterium]|nr:trigger factor [Candidatus Dependentiae bacterium]HRQ62577.1 trigger factor [Candidatus Dependentiae bacterium]